MKWREFEKLAREKGWFLFRHGSRHDIYRCNGRVDEMQIERHWSQEIRPRLLKKLLEQLNK